MPDEDDRLTWLSPEVWRDAIGERPGVPYLTAPVADPDLGTIVMLRLPDGHEIYSADQPEARREGRPSGL